MSPSSEPDDGDEMVSDTSENREKILLQEEQLESSVT
jgi:hypothetical protein